jgi:phage-related protein (TIGR01555 family)
MNWLYTLLTFMGLRRAVDPQIAALPYAPPPSPAPTPSPHPKSLREAYAERQAARLDSLYNPVSALGGANDKGTTARPDVGRELMTREERRALYRFNGYAARYINIVPDEATRKGWRIVQGKRDHPASAAIRAEEKRLNLYTNVADGHRWGRLDGGAHVWMVVDEEIPPGVDPLQVLATPLRAANVKRLLNLVVLDESEATPARWQSDPRSERFRKPLSWYVSPTSQGRALYSEVHYTRLLYFPGAKLPPSSQYEHNGYDDPILERVWDQIRNHTSTDQAAAALAQELVLGVLKIQGLQDLSLSDQAAAMEMRMAALAKSKSILNMLLLGEGEEFDKKGTPLTGFKDLEENASRALSAVTGLPQTLLYGDAPSGLNTDGESGEKAWNRAIRAVQETVYRDPLKHLYRILFAQKEGPLQEPGVWDIDFLPLEEPSEKEAADQAKVEADTDKIYIDAGVVTAQEVRRMRYPDLAEEDARIAAAQAAAQAATQPNPTPQPDGGAGAGGGQSLTPSGATLGAVTGDAVAADLPLRQEIPAGDIRRGIGPDGQPWAIQMPCDYGEIKGTHGLDGEPVDYLLHPTGPRGLAYIVDQLMAGEDAPELDEQKVILGCATEADARDLYTRTYGQAAEIGGVVGLPESQLLPYLAARSERRGYLLFDGINFHPPQGVKEELKRGLAWHDEGKSGDGLKPATVAWARRLAAGQPISVSKLKKMSAWLSRHEVDKQGQGYKPGEPGFPSPGRVAWALWGGDPAVSWSASLLRQVEAAKRA